MQCKGLLIAFFLVVSPVLYAGDNQDQGRLYEYNISRTIDGDTVVFEASFLPKPLNQKLSLRIYGIDAPELGWRANCKNEEKLAKKSKNFVQEKINQGNQILVLIKEWDSFGRVVGDIIIDGKSLRQKLIKKDYINNLNSNESPTWCQN